VRKLGRILGGATMGPKTFNVVVDCLYPIRRSFYTETGKLFDFPDYGGLPKKVSNKLSPEAVDAMQQVLAGIGGEVSCDFRSKREFIRAFRERLHQLGEPGNYGSSK
jgi:hypothetical protein